MWKDCALCSKLHDLNTLLIILYMHNVHFLNNFQVSIS